MAYWCEECPPDLLLIILQRLTDAADSINFSRVCRYWGIIAQDYLNRFIPYGAPCLMIPGTMLVRDTSSKSRRILAFPIGMNINEVLHSLPQVRVPHLDLCRGSHHGWLGMIANNMDMYLLNPFSYKRIDLPSVKTLKNPDTIKCKWDIKRILWSTSITDDYSNCFVLVVYDWNRELAFCNVGDKAWKYFFHVYDGIDDVAYCKNKWYVTEFKTGDIHTYDPNRCDLDRTIVDQTLCGSKNTFSPYLVELRGEILQVRQYFRRCTFISRDLDVIEDEYCEEKHLHPKEVDYSHIEIDFDGTFDYDNNFSGPWCTRAWTTETCGFKVFKMKTSSNGTKPCWTEIHDFGGDALFLGLNQPFFISKSHLFGYRENHIYFTDNWIHRQQNDCVTGHDVGMFSMKEQTTEPLYKSSFLSMRPPAIWVIPKP